MEIRGRQYEAVQGILTHEGTSPVAVIPGITGKTLYLNYILLSISEILSSVVTGELRDGSAGTAFWAQEILDYNMYIPTSYMLNFGQYGFALTEGNGLFAYTSSTNLDYTVTALGYYK